MVYQAEAATCNTCPLKARCTGSDLGRQVSRSFHEAYLDGVLGYHATADYRTAMRKRKVWPEPLFAEAKQWHGLHQFRLRGLQKVNREGLLVAAGQNLKRWLGATGWGRRHGPTGRLSVTGLTTALLIGSHCAAQRRRRLLTARDRTYDWCASSSRRIRPSSIFTKLKRR